MARSAFRTVISNVGGFLVFLILLGIANLLVPHISSSVYMGVVVFFNNSLVLFTIMMLVGLINDLLWGTYFPFNLLAPISSALLSVFIVTFIYRTWDFLNSYVQASFTLPKSAYLPVALIVLFAGYLLILVRKGRARDDYWHKMVGSKEKRGAASRASKASAAGKKAGEEVIEWQDVGEEFKIFFFRLGRSLNNLFKGKKTRPSKGKKPGKKK